MSLFKTGSGKALSYLSVEVGHLLNKKPNNWIQLRTYAARKGYREAAKKKKVKVVIQKQAWIPHNLRKKDTEDISIAIQTNEAKKPRATDDVWLAKRFAWRIYDFKEAVKCHRQTHHPTVYNAPDAQINLFVELDMSTARPTRFVDKFGKMAILPHIFEQDGLQERTVLAFCKTPEQQEEAQNAGANLVGGVEIIKDVERGKIVLPDFRFVIAHPTILPEMVTIRGLLKRRFPTVKSGTLGPNLGELITQFKNGVEFRCLKSEKQLDFGWISDVPIGRLNMELSKLEENFHTLLKDINSFRPKRPGPFIKRVVMSSPPSVEKLKINITPYVEEEQEDGESSDEDEAVPASL